MTVAETTARSPPVAESFRGRLANHRVMKMARAEELRNEINQCYEKAKQTDKETQTATTRDSRRDGEESQEDLAGKIPRPILVTQSWIRALTRDAA